MKKEVLFRTCVFGGYNKEDVMGYIGRLESELERLKNTDRGEAEKEAALTQQDEIIGDDMIVFNDQMVECSPPVKAMETGDDIAAEQAQRTSAAGSESVQELQMLKEKLERTGKELEQARIELEEKERQIERSGRDLEEKEWQLKKSSRELEEKEHQLSENNMRLGDMKRECEKLQKEHKAYKEDYQAIKNVLLNARVDAGVIVAKAQEKAKLIVAEAQRNVQLETRKSVALLVNHLKENQEGLDVSKVYLEQQLRSIDDVKQQIDGIRLNIENMCEQTQANQEEEQDTGTEGGSVDIEEEE